MVKRNSELNEQALQIIQGKDPKTQKTVKIPAPGKQAKNTINPQSTANPVNHQTLPTPQYTKEQLKTMSEQDKLAEDELIRKAMEISLQ